MPGLTCGSPCTEVNDDSTLMCLTTCTTDADCTDLFYNQCNTLSGYCTPSCVQASDCASYGFSACSGTGYCE
jgi:hypothetical protein